MDKCEIKPEGFTNDLSSFGVVGYDAYCGEPVSWGFKILNQLGDRFDSLREFGELLYIYPDWFLVTKRLSKEDAIKKYGEITHIERGPRGGFKFVAFGAKRFGSKFEGI